MEMIDIENAVAAAQKCGWSSDENLAGELAALRSPHYRVFLAGKFQVGKSLLADQVYLGGGKIWPGISPVSNPLKRPHP